MSNKHVYGLDWCSETHNIDVVILVSCGIVIYILGVDFNIFVIQFVNKYRFLCAQMTSGVQCFVIWALLFGFSYFYFDVEGKPWPFFPLTCSGPTQVNSVVSIVSKSSGQLINEKHTTWVLSERFKIEMLCFWIVEIETPDMFDI